MDFARRAPLGCETSTQLQMWTYKSESTLWKLHGQRLWPATHWSSPAGCSMLAAVLVALRVCTVSLFFVERWKAYRSKASLNVERILNANAHPLLRSW